MDEARTLLRWALPLLVVVDAAAFVAWAAAARRLSARWCSLVQCAAAGVLLMMALAQVLPSAHVRTTEQYVCQLVGFTATMLLDALIEGGLWRARAHVLHRSARRMLLLRREAEEARLVYTEDSSGVHTERMRRAPDFLYVLPRGITMAPAEEEEEFFLAPERRARFLEEKAHARQVAEAKHSAAGALLWAASVAESVTTGVALGTAWHAGAARAVHALVVASLLTDWAQALTLAVESEDAVRARRMWVAVAAVVWACAMPLAASATYVGGGGSRRAAALLTAGVGGVYTYVATVDMLAREMHAPPPPAEGDAAAGARTQALLVAARVVAFVVGMLATWPLLYFTSAADDE